MTISVVDIGTNTILLLVAQNEGHRIAKILHDEQVIARVGKGVDERRLILRESFERAADFLSAYRRTSESLKAERIIAVGTSAIRDAQNRDDFCEFIRQKTGITIEVLSGDEEAEWTFQGAIGENGGTSGNFTVLDIGGGSTEIIFGSRAKILRKVSLDIGCVRISERVLRAQPPTKEMVASAQTLIRKALERIEFDGINTSTAVAVAGTVTTLAAMRLRLDEYDPASVEGFELRRRDVEEEFERLQGKTIDQLRSIRQISPGREDILLAGVLILREFMEWGRLEEIRVSDRGLRYGIMLREIRHARSDH